MEPTVDGAALRTREKGISYLLQRGHSLSTDTYGLIRPDTRYPYTRTLDGKFLVSPDILVIQAGNGTTTLAFNVNVRDIAAMRCDLLETTLEIERERCYIGSALEVLYAVRSYAHKYIVVDVVYTEEDGVYYTMLQGIHSAYSSLQGEGARDVLPIIARNIEIGTKEEREKEDSIRAEATSWLEKRARKAVSNRREIVAALLSEVQERIAEEARHSPLYIDVRNEIDDMEGREDTATRDRFAALHQQERAILRNFYPTADLLAEEERWLDALRTLVNVDAVVNEVVKIVLPDAIRVRTIDSDEMQQLKERIDLALDDILLM